MGYASDVVRDVAIGHAERHRHYVMWMPAVGWVCRECDDDYEAWLASDVYQEFFDGRAES